MINLNTLKKYYINSPLWMKKLYGKIPFEIRNGSEYRKWRNFLNKDISIEEYELIKLKETVSYAYENTIYYKELFNKMDISPYDINERKDLEQLPILDKKLVQKNYDKLIVKNFPIRKTFEVITGGSSGTPMKFLQSKNIWAKEVAFTMDHFNKYGFLTNMLKASFRGGDFENLPTNIYWKDNPHSSEIHFSPFHINNETIHYYVKILNSKKIKYIQTYPSSIKFLIECMINTNLKLNYQINTIFLLSEEILDSDVELIKVFFNCEVSSFYGHSERLIFAPNHANDLSSYTIDRRYGFFELLDNNQHTIDENNVIGEIVGTSFDNYVMPLLRYRTDDMTSLEDNKNYIIHRIIGDRKYEYLNGKLGMKASLTALNMHSDIFKNVIKYQYVQSEPGTAVLCMSVKNDFSAKDKKLILDALNKKAGHSISFKIKIVDNFILTHRGKFKNIVKYF